MSALHLDRETVAYIAEAMGRGMRPEAFLASLERHRLRANLDGFTVGDDDGEVYGVWCRAITNRGTRCAYSINAKRDDYSDSNQYCSRHHEQFTQDAAHWLLNEARPAEVDDFVARYLSDGFNGLPCHSQIAQKVDALVEERIQSVWGVAS